MEKKPVNNETLLHQLQWRYATKKFDPQRTIPENDWRTLEQCLVLTPSSFGLQPWKFIVITDRDWREQLVPLSWGQRQVADCSHLVVMAIKRQVQSEDVQAYIRRISEVREVEEASLTGFRDMMVKTLVDKPSIDPAVWASRQAYIALGNLMTAAALLGIDTCPMEGFIPEKYDELLKLPERGWASSVACALGYRTNDDKYARVPKVRFRAEDVIEHLPG